MNIGIFGDSFCSTYRFNASETFIDLLGKSYNVISHGLDGTDIWYSVKKLIDFSPNETFDIIIFFLTFPHRVLPPGLHFFQVPFEKSARRQKLDWFKTKTNNAEEILNAIGYYYDYLIDFEKNEFYRARTMDWLLNFSNLILIDIHEINRVYIKEYELWGITKDAKDNKLIDLRNNHMTAQSHEILYLKIKNMIDNKKFGKLDINQDDFPCTCPLGKEFYFKEK
jgi:hypothetical protein